MSYDINQSGMNKAINEIMDLGAGKDKEGRVYKVLTKLSRDNLYISGDFFHGITKVMISKIKYAKELLDITREIDRTIVSENSSALDVRNYAACYKMHLITSLLDKNEERKNFLTLAFQGTINEQYGMASQEKKDIYDNIHISVTNYMDNMQP